MITAVTGIGFKGLDFDHHLEPLHLFLGPNGAGKSARTQAAILALNGYVPGSAKTNAALLENFGAGNKMVVGVKIDGKHFERGFVRTEEGKVGQGYKIAGKKATEKAFYAALAEAGAPKVLDVSIFLEQSAQKKIDAIFDLYPPDENLNSLTTQIDAAKEKINALTQKARSAEDAASRLVTARAAIELPAGSYAELIGQIHETEKELERARNDLREAETEAAQAKGREEGKAAAVSTPAKQTPMAPAPAAPPSEEPGPLEREIIGRYGDNTTSLDHRSDRDFFTIASPLGQRAAALTTELSVAAVQTIINAMKTAGCSACAARLVAIRELRRLEGGHNA